jgi:hypothetical protein
MALQREGGDPDVVLERSVVLDAMGAEAVLAAWESENAPRLEVVARLEHRRSLAAGVAVRGRRWAWA